MRRTFLLVILIMVESTLAKLWAQEGEEGWPWPKKLELNVKYGLNVTNISNLPSNREKVSFHLGYVVAYNMSKRYSFQTELLYSRQGFVTGKVDGWRHRVRMNYLNVPVLARVEIWRGWRIEAGPQADILLNAKEKYRDDDRVFKRRVHAVNPIGLSLAMGVSCDFDGVDVFMSMRYNLGLTNVMEKEVVGENNRNHVFQFSVGKKF